VVETRATDAISKSDDVAPGLVRETVPARPPTRLVGTGVRVLFGLVWVVDVYFKWQPTFLHRLPEVMGEGAKGQPGWLRPWFNFAQGVIAVHPTAWAYAIALAETGIALALILGFARKLTYVGGAIYSLMIWSTAEGLGRTSGVATDIGTAIIYAVVFLALVALDARGKGTRPYSVDAVIERRLAWWRRVAEIRR
jgi:nitrite reductase (NO-forming)